ncbi:hypothetical protein C7964_101840 [Loktanella sp. PT4BL]|jgi:hypothetical protein|uniref:hypothetical protein n=1 Tax=Loktanella sp. PT4BL TaxID=2135611 RepID=UPI000D7668EF|nr:hypothetical protein [Loktanella sp. PT4BL]PXW72724.1 hypothetical protein C7964_101840 [Loktanella sp. PT4BL]
MKLIRHIVCFFQVLLFALSGASVAFASVGSWQKVEFHTHHSEVALQQTNLAFAARAPPYVAVNVATAGTLVHGNGDVRALIGAKGTGVAFAFLQSSIAPNRTVGGDPIEGLRVIGRGEDLIGSMVLSGAEEAFLFSNEHFPAATEAFVEAMMRAGEGAAVMVNFADKATGQVVSTAWNDLPQDTRDAIIGGGVVVSFVVPAGAATRIARATPDVATNGGNRPDFYVSPNGEAVEGTLYRYSDSVYADDILQNGGSPAIDGRGHYLGTEALDSASSVRDRYQIAPEWSNPTVRGELDSIQLYDPNTSTWRLQTPTSNGNTTTIPEPYTSAYPEYGTGGARQYTTDPNTPIRYDNVDIIGD